MTLSLIIKALSHFYFKNLPRPTQCEKLPKAELTNKALASGVKRKANGTIFYVERL